MSSLDELSPCQRGQSRRVGQSSWVTGLRGLRRARSSIVAPQSAQKQKRNAFASSCLWRLAIGRALRKCGDLDAEVSLGLQGLGGLRRSTHLNIPEFRI